MPPWDASRPTRYARPTLEQLEDRLVLSPVAGTSAPLLPAPLSNQAQVASATVTPTTLPKYKITKLVHVNEFVDSVTAVRVDNGRYNVSLTVAKGFKVGDVIQQTKAPTAAVYYMVIQKSFAWPWDKTGSLQLSRIDRWWNGKPTIKGFNYPYSLTAPKWFHDKVQKGDIIRQVKTLPGMPPSWRWGPMSSDTEVEKFLYENGAGMPNVLNGKITTIGPSTGDFNCIGYAASYGSGTSPKAAGWIAKFPFSGDVNVTGRRVPYTNWNGLAGILRGYGWRPMISEPHIKTGPYLVLFTDAANNITHAAVWTYGGVYAKMGLNGTFRFDSLDQMSGALYGKPTIWLSR